MTFLCLIIVSNIRASYSEVFSSSNCNNNNDNKIAKLILVILLRSRKSDYEGFESSG